MGAGLYSCLLKPAQLLLLLPPLSFPNGSKWPAPALLLLMLLAFCTESFGAGSAVLMWLGEIPKGHAYPCLVLESRLPKERTSFGGCRKIGCPTLG